MKRRRPIFINIAVVFFLFYYLVPIESLFSFVFGVTDKMVRGGSSAAFTHLKAVFAKDAVYEHIRTIVAMLSIAGLLRMSKIAMLMLTALIVFRLTPVILAGQLTLLGGVLPILFLLVTWFFYFHVPKVKITKADVHRADPVPKRSQEVGREAGRKATDELIY